MNKNSSLSSIFPYLTSFSHLFFFTPILPLLLPSLLLPPSRFVLHELPKKYYFPWLFLLVSPPHTAFCQRNVLTCTQTSHWRSASSPVDEHPTFARETGIKKKIIVTVTNRLSPKYFLNRNKQTSFASRKRVCRIIHIMNGLKVVIPAENIAKLCNNTVRRKHCFVPIINHEQEELII